jgi:hypothetical protein
MSRVVFAWHVVRSNGRGQARLAQGDRSEPRRSPAVAWTDLFAQETYSYWPTSLSVVVRMAREKDPSLTPRRNIKCMLPAIVESRTNFLPSRSTTSVSRKLGLAEGGG